ncbi:MAG: EpsI family protein [Burkholderiales bacterium]|nr:EpsI family protein [Burkholderiales bacterium]
MSGISWLSPVRVRALFAALVLASASGAAHVAKPTVHLADQQAKVELESIFPASFGGWRVDSQQPVGIISPDVAELLSKLYAQTLTRTYVGPGGERMMLSVAYGGDQSDATRAHRPDVCYPAQGFSIVASADANVDTGSGKFLNVRHMYATLGSRHEPVTFWFVVGDQVAVSGTQQKLAQLQYGMRGLIPDGMLVRVSSIDADPDAGYRAQAGFIADLRQAMPAAIQSRVFGADVGR